MSATDESRSLQSVDPSAARRRGRVVVLICVIAAGVVLRFHDLGAKPYWFDESITSLSAGGHDVPEIARAVCTGQPTTAGDIQRFTHVDPRSRARDVVVALAIGDPQHPPLYFLIAHAWAIVVRDSPAAMRALAAIFSLIALPLAYALARELFASRAAAEWVVVLIAVSPVQVLYAQESREYSLWVVTILASTLALLRAQRIDTQPAWAIYLLTCVIGMFTHTLFVMALVAHIAYVLLARAPRRQMFRYFLALGACAALFAPWAIVIIRARGEMAQHTSWLNEAPYSRPNLVARFVHLLSVNFIDLFAFPPAVPKHVIAVPMIAGLCVSVMAVIGILRGGPAMRRAAILMSCMIVVPVVALLLPDLLVGGRRSTNPRYFFPLYIAITLATAHWIGAASAGATWTRLRTLIGIALVAAGICSAVRYASASDWWSKGDGAGVLRASAAILNRESHPVIVSNLDEVKVGSILAIARLLRPDAEFILSPDAQWPTMPSRDAPQLFLLTDKPTKRVRPATYPFGIEPTPSRMVYRIRGAR